jgi:tetratricopeptide (TPR) repeat protein
MRLDSLGDVLRWQGDYAGALVCFLEAADRAAQIGNIELEAHARTDIGLLAHFFGDDARSVRELRKGLLLARQARDLWCECRAEAALAWHEFVINGDAGALTTLRNVVNRAHVAQETSAEVHALTALGAALLASGDLDSAEAALREAVTLQRTLNATMILLTPLAHLADLQRRQGKLIAALGTVDELLLVLGERQVGGVDDPLLVYAICTQILRATADPRAEVIAKRGRQHLLAQGALHPELPLSKRVHKLLDCE